MSIHHDISLDMDYDTDTALEFVNSKDPNAIEFNLSDYYSTHGNGPGMMNQYVSSMGDATDDVNDSWLGDAWDAVSGAGKSLLQGVGLMNSDKPEDESKESLPEPTKQSLPSQPQRVTQSEENIKQLQTYFKNPSANLQSFIGGIKYSGPIDGKDGSGTRRVVSALESSLNKLFNTRRFSGAVISTSPQDIEKALQRANDYKAKMESQTSGSPVVMATKTNRDDRFYKIGKKLISNK